MKELDILQDMLDDLASEKIRYLIIPCNNEHTAVYIMKALAMKGIKWSDNTELNENTKWQIYGKETLYAIEEYISPRTGEHTFQLIYGCMDNIQSHIIDRFDYAILPHQAILLS
jgi:hypothetical protein